MTPYLKILKGDTSSKALFLDIYVMFSGGVGFQMSHLSIIFFWGGDAASFGVRLFGLE